MAADLNQIIEKFDIIGEVERIEALGEGFINDTYTVVTKDPNDDNYLLQLKNKNVFKFIPGMMDNIEKITNHLKLKIVESAGDPDREALTVTKTKDGKLYYQDEDGEYWAVCIFIKDSITHDRADSLDLARAGGKGIGKFQSMLADFEGDLVDTLPGFHNMKFRFQQWDEIIAKDPVGRKKDLAEEISWIESRREKIMDFWTLVENGTIPQRVTHNDTKISNILFDQAGEVLCVIDLDTVLNSIVLNDFGDAMRSYTNTGMEDDPNLENVSMNIEIFKAFSEGYISETSSFLTAHEIEYLAFSACLITFEQVLRFLMDYIDGDNYYQVKHDTHNLVRTRAQYKLLQSMEAQLPLMNDIVKQIVASAGK